MVSKAEATEKFYEGFSMGLSEGKVLPKPPDITEILKILSLVLSSVNKAFNEKDNCN